MGFKYIIKRKFLLITFIASVGLGSLLISANVVNAAECTVSFNEPVYICRRVTDPDTRDQINICTPTGEYIPRTKPCVNNPGPVPGVINTAIIDPEAVGNTFFYQVPGETTPHQVFVPASTPSTPSTSCRPGQCCQSPPTCGGGCSVKANCAGGCSGAGVGTPACNRCTQSPPTCGNGCSVKANCAGSCSGAGVGTDRCPGGGEDPGVIPDPCDGVKPSSPNWCVCNPSSPICNPPVPGFCGNRIREGTEQCDRGVANGVCPAICSNICIFNTCVADEPIVELIVSGKKANSCYDIDWEVSGVTEACSPSSNPTNDTWQNYDFNSRIFGGDGSGTVEDVCPTTSTTLNLTCGANAQASVTLTEPFIRERNPGETQFNLFYFLRGLFPGFVKSSYAGL